MTTGSQRRERCRKIIQRRGMMLARSFVGVLVAAMLLCAPGSAAAAPAGKERPKVRTLVGKVVGQPYALPYKRTAVPMMLSKASAKRARLGSVVGVLVVKKKGVRVFRQKAKVAPRLLRVADEIW